MAIYGVWWRGRKWRVVVLAPASRRSTHSGSNSGTVAIEPLHPNRKTFLAAERPQREPDDRRPGGAVHIGRLTERKIAAPLAGRRISQAFDRSPGFFQSHHDQLCSGKP